MATLSLNDYLDENTGKLWQELKIELPVESDPNSLQQLKKMVAYAESRSMDIAVWYRRLTIHIDNLEKDLCEEYEKECKSQGTKSTVSGLERYLKNKTSTERAWKKELEDLQGILKRRVLLGQSLLKSNLSESSTFSSQAKDLRLE